MRMQINQTQGSIIADAKEIMFLHLYVCLSIG